MPQGLRLGGRAPVHAARIRPGTASSSVAAFQDRKLLLPVHDQLAAAEAPGAVGAAAVAVLVADAPVQLARLALPLEQVVGDAVCLARRFVAAEVERLVV